MFTLAQIKAAHAEVKSGADFPKYVQDLIGLGVAAYDTFVSDGHTDYFSADGFSISSGGLYPSLTIAAVADVQQFKADLKTHQSGKTDYMTFCKDCAKSGIEKWQVRTNELTCTYYDSAGNALLIENIPQ